MTEKPILFSGTMVRAILDGSKTQTRRIAKEDDDGAFLAHRYNVGDRLWVKETFAEYGEGDQIMYWATCDKETRYATNWYERGFKWRPSIFMPRALSRIDLEVTEVRVQRLNDISEDDAWEEGYPAPAGMNRDVPDRARYWFRCLWEDLNSAPGHRWEDNPFVWAYTFRRVKP